MAFRCLETQLPVNPAVMAETDDWVAMASEFRALSDLPHVNHAKVWEPEPATVYSWGGKHDRISIGSGRKGRPRRQRDFAGRATSPTGPYTVCNPAGKHAVAAGLTHPVSVKIDGHVGYYCAGMNEHAIITIDGNAGTGVAENMMSGEVRVCGDASQSASATRTADGSLSKGMPAPGARSESRRDVVVGGSVGHMSAFMAQSGRLVVCGDAGAYLGDSLYEAEIYVRGNVESLGGLRREGHDGIPP